MADIVGLTPDQLYSYEVLSPAATATSGPFTFKTAPTPGTRSSCDVYLFPNTAVSLYASVVRVRHSTCQRLLSGVGRWGPWDRNHRSTCSVGGLPARILFGVHRRILAAGGQRGRACKKRPLLSGHHDAACSSVYHGVSLGLPCCSLCDSMTTALTLSSRQRCLGPTVSVIDTVSCLHSELLLAGVDSQLYCPLLTLHRICNSAAGTVPCFWEPRRVLITLHNPVRTVLRGVRCEATKSAQYF